MYLGLRLPFPDRPPVWRTYVRHLVILLSLFLATCELHARTPSEWYVEPNRTGPIARVFGTAYERVEFLVAFEYVKGCEPIFSMVQFKSLTLRNRSLGTLLTIQAFPPNSVFVSVNDRRHTWHGATAFYANGSETGIGITRDLWTSLMSSPRSVAFTEQNGKTYTVPTKNISGALRDGLRLCQVSR